MAAASQADEAAWRSELVFPSSSLQFQTCITSAWASVNVHESTVAVSNILVMFIFYSPSGGAPLLKRDRTAATKI